MIAGLIMLFLVVGIAGIICNIIRGTFQLAGAIIPVLLKLVGGIILLGLLFSSFK